MHTLAVVHPVGHAPHRYTAIAQPSLLIFDTEDAGHPVSVGRQMRQHLPNPRYFEFTRSVDGDWEVHHTGEEMIAMMLETYPGWKNKRLGGRRDKDLPDLTRVAGGFNGWNDKHGEEFDAWGGYDEADAPDLPTAVNENCWRAKLDKSTNTNCSCTPSWSSGVFEKLEGRSQVPHSSPISCFRNSSHPFPRYFHI